MAKVAVVYWSGTGNTAKMTELVAEGATQKGADVTIFTSADFTKDMVADYDGIAFGCPSMGAEVLEESEFQPMWDDVKDSLSGKKVVLYGSYGWGDGEWMRNWEEEAGSVVVETYICNGEPSGDGEDACKDLGANLA